MNLRVAEASELSGNNPSLPQAKLQSQRSSRRQVFACRLDECANVGKTIWSAVECRRWIVLNLALQVGKFLRDDVGQVRDDPIEWVGHGREQIRLVEVDLGRVPNRILASKAKCFDRNIRCGNSHARAFKSQRNRDDSRARPNIKNADLIWSNGKMLDDQLHELLGLRPRNKGSLVAEKGSSKKFSRPQKVLERSSCSPIADQPAKRRSLGFRERPVELEV